MAWKPGRRIRWERELRGWELEDVAQRMAQLSAFLQMPDPGIDADAVDGWEYGAKMTPACLALLSTVLETPAAELVGLLDPLALPELDALIAEGPGTIAVDEVERREFIRLALVALGEVAALEPDRLDAALSRRAVDRHTVHQLRWAIRQAAGQYDAVPARLLRQRAANYVEAVQGLLAGPLPVGLRRELLSVGAEAATLAGWASRSDGSVRHAAGYYVMAETLASSAGDAGLLAFTMTRTADLHSGIQRGVGQAGDTGPVRPLLDRAEDLAGPSAPPALRAHIALRQAEEHAAAGETREAAHYLDRADATFSIAEAGRDGLYGIPWNPGIHDCYRGNVTLLAGRPDLAAAVLERVLREMPAGTVSNRSSVLADLGAAYAQQGQVDYACEVLGEAFGVATGAGLAHRAQRVVGLLRQHLAAHEHEPVVRRLAEQIVTR